MNRFCIYVIVLSFVLCRNAKLCFHKIAVNQYETVSLAAV